MSHIGFLGAVLAISLVACGDDRSGAPDGGSPDALSCAPAKSPFALRAGMDNESFRALASTTERGLLVAGSASGGAWLVKVGADKTVAWQKRYGDASGTGAFFTVNAMETTGDGGAIVAGTSATAGANGDSDWWVAKLNGLGVISWQQALNFTRQDEASVVRQTADGGFVVAGYVNGKAGVVKLDPNGAVAWQKLYAVPRTVETFTPWDLQPARDGGFVVVGTLATEPYPAWVMRLDATGAIRWLNSYPGGGGSIYPTADGGYVMSGPVGYEPGGAWAVKLDDAGQVAWQQRYSEAATDGGAPGSYGVAAIRPSSAGGYVIAGRIRRIETQAWLLGIDANGSLKWQQAYGKDQSSVEAFALERTADCGYGLAGAFGPWGSAGSGMLLKVDGNGDLPGSTLLKSLSFAADAPPTAMQPESGVVQDGRASVSAGTATASDTNVNITDLP